MGGSPTPTINSNLVAGRGFTAILVAWLGQLNPFVMMGTAFLVVFFQAGSAQVATTYQIGDSSAFSGVIIGIFFIIVIAAEFLVSYNVIFRQKHNKKEVVKVEEKKDIETSEKEEDLELEPTEENKEEKEDK